MWCKCLDKNVIFKNRLRKAAERQGWWNSDGMVVAVSGGGDSVAMLWLLNSIYKGRLVVAHLDHCTRAGKSHEDSAFVEELCKKNGIKYYIKSIDVNREKLVGESFEMAARRERYSHFNDVAKNEDIFYIAVGHSADDLVETQLINLFRGTGLKGLRGIPEVNKNIVRPVIDFRRKELREILLNNDISWREDSSNLDTKYYRNRIRNELIPWIHQNMNKNFEVLMLGLARQIEDELVERSTKTAILLDNITISQPPALVAWSATKIKSLSKIEIIDMLRKQGEELNLPTLSRNRTENLFKLIEKGGFWRFQWARDIEVCYSERGIGWIHRNDVEKSLQKNKQKTKGNMLPWWAR